MSLLSMAAGVPAGNPAGSIPGTSPADAGCRKPGTKGHEPPGPQPPVGALAWFITPAFVLCGHGCARGSLVYLAAGVDAPGTLSQK